MSNVFGINELKWVIHSLASKIRKPDFLTYFKKISLVSVENNTVVYGVVSSFYKDNLTKKYYNDFKEATLLFFPTCEAIDIVVDDNIESGVNQAVMNCSAELKEVGSKKKKEEVYGVEVVDGINSRLINDRYRLDNFIVGPSTQLAHAACEAVGRRPGASYNPLYIYGNVGLGKTHLLQGTANTIKDRHKDLKVVYTTADRFLTDYVGSIKNRSIDKLRDKYRAIDVLVIDDVQFLAGKDQTQQELYNIFNILYEAGKQIILSGDRPPKELTNLEPRLTSRFEWGITVDVGEPDFETRLAILQTKAQSREFIIGQDVAEFIAEHVTTNVREIEGILNQVIAEYDLRGIPPTKENVAIRLSKLSVKSLTRTLEQVATKTLRSANCSYEDLIQAVSEHFGIEIKNLIWEDRRKENMIPRQVAMYLLKTRLDYTYERIGNIFSGRNHTAIMYSCKKLEQVMKKDQQVVYEMSIIRNKLGI